MSKHCREDDQNCRIYRASLKGMYIFKFGSIVQPVLWPANRKPLAELLGSILAPQDKPFSESLYMCKLQCKLVARISDMGNATWKHPEQKFAPFHAECNYAGLYPER